MDAPSIESLLGVAAQVTGAGWAALLRRDGDGWRALGWAGAGLPNSIELSKQLDGGSATRLSLPNSDAILALGGRPSPDIADHERIALTGIGAGLSALLAVEAGASANNASTTGDVAALSQIGQAILGTLDMEEVLARLMAEIRRVVGVEATSILLWDETDQALTFSAADGPTTESILGMRVPPGEGIAGWVAQHRLPALVLDVRSDSRWYPKVDEAIAFHSQSLACVPILRRDQLVGVLEAVNKTEGAFTRRDLELLEALSNWAAEAIVNARTFEAQRRQRQTAESLAQVAALVAATLDLPQVLARVLDQVMSLVDCNRASIALRAGDEMRPAASRSRKAGSTGRLNLADDTLTAEVLRTRQAARQPAAEPGGPARLAVPLAIGERIVGLIALERPARDFVQADIDSIAALIHPAATAIENAQLYAEATRRLQEMTILHEVSLATSTTLDLDQLLHRTAQTLYHSMNYERVLILLSEASNQGQMLALHPASIGIPADGAVAPGRGAAGLATQRRQTVRLDDTRRDARFEPPAHGAPTLSQLAVPLLAGDRAVGVLVLESSRPSAFTTEDEWLLTIVARQLATALENSRLFTAVQERAVNLTVLNYVARQIVGALDANEIFRLAVAELGERFVYALAAVFTLDESGQRLEVRGLSGTQAHLVPGNVRWLSTAGVADRVIQTGEVVLANRLSGESIFAGLPGLNLGSELCAPILRDGRALGILAVAHAHAGGFTETDVLTLEALAGMLANALRSASLFADVQARIAELRQAQAQLVQSEKFAAIGRLTASIAHEVNNPLQSIHNCLRLASEGRLPADRRAEYLNMAEGELVRLMDIVRRMLEYYRPAAVERAAVSVNWLVEDVLALSGKQLADAGVNLRCDFSPDVHQVTVVANHVRQVFLNLILNAVEAMPSGGSLRITTYNANGEVRVRFEDSGPGVAADDLSKIFEPFYTTKSRGTGLGLSVSYGIIAAHGGWIAIDSEPGRGAAFTVHLPINDSL